MLFEELCVGFVVAFCFDLSLLIAVIEEKRRDQRKGCNTYTCPEGSSQAIAG